MKTYSSKEHRKIEFLVNLMKAFAWMAVLLAVYHLMVWLSNLTPNWSIALGSASGLFAVVLTPDLKKRFGMLLNVFWFLVTLGIFLLIFHAFGFLIWYMDADFHDLSLYMSEHPKTFTLMTLNALIATIAFEHILNDRREELKVKDWFISDQMIHPMTCDSSGSTCERRNNTGEGILRLDGDSYVCPCKQYRQMSTYQKLKNEREPKD